MKSGGSLNLIILFYFLIFFQMTGHSGSLIPTFVQIYPQFLGIKKIKYPPHIGFQHVLET
jgi:hypothetical protein